MRRLSPFLLAALLAACGGGDDDAPLADAGPDDPDAGDPADAGACTEPLAADVLADLVISFEPTISLRPGQTFQFETAVIECCYVSNPVPACATWSVSPAEGATISPTGLFTVDPATPHGAVFTVSADVEDGRRVLTAAVHVYTPEGNPLVGFWTEQAQLECGPAGGEAAPEQVIQELRFKADGTFGVTWLPFEIYVDYWGAYTHDLASGALTLVVEGGNYVPPDVDGAGRFVVAGDELTLRDLWLGTPQGGTAPARCGHRFAR